MNWKKFFIALITIYVVGGVLNFLVHGVLLMSAYQELASIWRTDMDSYMWIQWVTALFLCFFFVYIFVRGYEGRGIMEGVRFGLVIWAFMTIPSVYSQFMVYPLPYSLILKWLFSDLVIWVVMGVLTALIYKPAEQKAAATG